MDLLVSQQLLASASDIEQEYYEGLSAEERKEAESNRSFASNVAKAVVLSREVLAPETLPQLETFVNEHRNTVEYLLDEHFAIQQLKNVSSLVRRTMKLAQLGTRDTPSKQTNRYIRESSRAYIHGLDLASIAMSRAALEQAFKEKLGKQGDKQYAKLRKLINDAKNGGILGKSDAEAAIDLANKCNTVMHERPIDDEDSAFEIFSAVRSMLEKIYGDDRY